MATRVRVIVRGRVQGVGFRVACRERAIRLGVSGWVRNEPDGGVSALFEGADDAVDTMTDWCRSGPPGAAVEQVEVRPDEGNGAVEGFEVRI